MAVPRVAVLSPAGAEPLMFGIVLWGKVEVRTLVLSNGCSFGVPYIIRCCKNPETEPDPSEEDWDAVFEQCSSSVSAKLSQEKETSTAAGAPTSDSAVTVRDESTPLKLDAGRGFIPGRGKRNVHVEFAGMFGFDSLSESGDRCYLKVSFQRKKTR
jgi:hypothetical protein